MTGDTKRNVENEGAATEQVALNKWCHPIGPGSGPSAGVAEPLRKTPCGSFVLLVFSLPFLLGSSFLPSALGRWVDERQLLQAAVHDVIRLGIVAGELLVHEHH